jgi:hypothetical protein
MGDLSEKMYGNKERVKKQKEALALLDSSGFPFFVNTTINELNYRFMPEYVEYIHSNFKSVKHVVFNFLDPGCSDGVHISNAGKNPWVVPKYSEIEIYLNKAFSLLRKFNITFRVERVPLCYLDGFEEFCTETRKISKEENYVCSFIQTENQKTIRKVDFDNQRTKAKCCAVCRLNNICIGIQKEYVRIHGKNELYPVFKSEEAITGRIS